MELEIKKMKRNETIMSILLGFFCLLFVLVLVFVIANKNNLSSEEPLVIDKTSFVRVELVENSNYLEFYKTANIKKINFLNIPSEMINDFYTKQDNIIETLNNNLINNKQIIEQYNTTNNIEDYEKNSSIDSTILCELKDDILSLLYLVEEEVDYVGLNNYITNIFIDTSSNNLVNTDDIINKYNINKENISLELFNNIVNYHTNKFIDKDTKEEKTLEDILVNKEIYLKKLNDNFDKYVYLYFNQDSLYLKYNRNEIANFLFNEELENVKYSTLKINN